MTLGGETMSQIKNLKCIQSVSFFYPNGLQIQYSFFSFIFKFLFINLILIPTSGHTKSINIHPLSFGLNSSYLGLEDASLADQPFSNRRSIGRKFFFVNYSYDKSPWVLLSQDKSSKKENVVSSMQSLDFGWGWLLNDQMQVGLESFGSMISVAPQYGGESTSHMGDTRLNLKYRFMTDTFWSMAVMPELTIPTGAEYEGHYYGASVSNSSLAPGVRFMGEFRTTENQWVFNLGYSYFDKAEYKSPHQEYPKIDGRSRLFLGSGWLTKINQNWAFNSEYSTQIPTGTNHFTPPGLLTLGARYQPAQTMSWQFGVGTGAFGAASSKASGNDSFVYTGIKIPLFGSSYESQSTSSSTNKIRYRTKSKISGDYDDPLLQEAYKKELVDHSSDRSTLRSSDIIPYSQQQTNPFDENSN